MKRLLLLPIFVLFVLAALPARLPAQLVNYCETIRHFDPAAADRVFTKSLPTPWFAVRFSGRYDTRVDTAYIGFGITRPNTGATTDTLLARIYNNGPQLVNVLDQLRLAIPPNLSGQIPDSYMVVEFMIGGSSPTIPAPNDFWLAWKLLGPATSTARIPLKTPARAPNNSVVLDANNAPSSLHLYIFNQVRDTCDLYAEVHVCYPNGVPVELASFDAAYSAGAAVLDWSTESETDNFGYYVERSAALSEDHSVTIWEQIGFVPGSGTTHERRSYRFNDPLAHLRANDMGLVKYRLKQTDYNGAVTYSQARTVRIPSQAEGLTLDPIHPQPAGSQGMAMTGFTLPAAGHVRIALHDATGRLVSTVFDGHAEAGWRGLTLDLQGLPAGSYFCTLSSAGTLLTRRLTILP